MPGFLVHQGATVICPHGGQAQPTAPFPRVLLANQPVTVQTAPYVVAACGLIGSGSPPCLTAQWVVAATRVRAGGMPVLLQDSQAICAPSGAPLTIAVTQVRVKGM